MVAYLMVNDERYYNRKARFGETLMYYIGIGSLCLCVYIILRLLVNECACVGFADGGTAN